MRCLPMLKPQFKRRSSGSFANSKPRPKRHRRTLKITTLCLCACMATFCSQRDPINQRSVGPWSLVRFSHASIPEHVLALSVAYLKAYQLNENDQLVNMSLGVALLHRAMNRQSDNRHLLIVQGLTFLFKYFDLKGGDEEACFNIGRAFHQLGLFHLAIPYYEKVLSAEEAQEDGETHKREAAYNLCAIYMATGSAPLAHMVMRKYCVV